MKFILYLFLVVDVGGNPISVLIKGPSFNTQKACEAHGKNFDAIADFPIANAAIVCEKEKTV